MKTQKKDSAKSTAKTTDTSKKSSSSAKDMKKDDMKKVRGGSGLLSGGNDLTNMVGGTVGISNSSSGSNDGHSYSSNDSHNADLGLGNILDNTNY